MALECIRWERWRNFKEVIDIAGQCRTNPWPAVPDWTLMPECRYRTKAADYRKKCRCRTSFSPAFWHLHMIFQYHITRITQSAAVYGRAGCVPFTTNNTSSMDVTRRVYSFPQPAVWTFRAYTFPPPAVWTCRVYPFPQPAVWACRVYPFPPSAVWTCRVSSFPPTAVLTCRV